MKKISQLLILIMFFGTALDLNAQNREQDSLALVALYNATDGANWTNNTNWLSSEPIDTWYGVEVLDNRVDRLLLYKNGLLGSIPAEIGVLTNLTTLGLDNNELSGSVPIEIGNLTNLGYLRLSINQLSGSIPSEIGNLTNLNYLYLDHNQLTGSIPAEIGNLSNLNDLSLGSNQLTGSIPAEIGNLSNLINLYLALNQLTIVPTEIGNLTNLSSLSIGNNQLSGSLPAEVGNLSSLEYLSLSNNQLSGSIPTELGNLMNLTQLYLYGNQFTGSIPVELGYLTNLTDLSLSNNQLSGSIPVEIGNLMNLTALNLNNNQLSGSIPEELNNLSALQRLYINNNEFTSLPAFTISSLAYLEVENNKLTFEDIVPNIGISSFSYSPQDNIGIASNRTGYTGQEISFTVGGGGDTWQWQKDGVAIANGGNISGANAETLLLTNLDISDEGDYHCEIMNSNAPDLTLYSRPITLKVSTPIETVTDIDGNTYNTVTIGTQTWMAENLKTTKYSNGDLIGTTTPATLDISGETEPKYQWAAYGDESYVDTYGRYYTWHAITDSRGVCPSGWHVPSDAEWTTLTDYLTNNGYGFEGSGDDIAKSMAATSGWTADPTAGNVGNDQASNNSSGFSALPAAQRGDLSLWGNYTYWWSSTESIYTPTAAVNRLMATSSNNLNDKLHHSKYSGLSVRCLKDSEATPPLLLTVQDVTVNEGQALEIPISVSELVTDDNIISYQFKIDYDHTTLQYTGNDLTGTLADGGTATVNSSVDGTLNISYMTSTAIVGAGDILKLNFNTLKIDTTEIVISNAFLNATEVTDLTTGTVIVKDVTPPTFTAPDDVTIYSDASCNYDASIAVTGDVEDEADNYAVGEATYVDVIDNSNTCAVIITRTWSLVDDFGNAAPNQVQTITVEDNIPPTFTAPADITIQSDASCNYDASIGVTGDVSDEADNCGVGEATYSDAIDDSNPCAVIITRTWSLSDNCGNAAADQVQTITVEDITPPTATITYDDTENRCGDELLITATFNEPMLETNAVKISMTGGATVAAEDMVRVSDSEYTYLLSIPNSSGSVTVSLSNGTDLSGNEITSTPTSGETFSITPINYGDVDDDGKIMAYDAALTLQYSVGLDPLPTIDPLPWENWRDTTANVDGIGAVTANDAAMILQYSAKLITGFDASVKKSVSQAFISIEVINNEIILYSNGDLLGLNISAINKDQILGTPVILADNLLSAFNISGNTYKIGLCTTKSPENGVAVMKIPFTKSGVVTLDMIINTDTDARTLNLSFYEPTGTQDLNADNIIIYPNPARDLLSVQGLQKETTGRIYNTSGQMVFSSEIDAEKGEINVSALPSGLYILKMNVGEGVLVKRFIKE